MIKRLLFLFLLIAQVNFVYALSLGFAPVGSMPMVVATSGNATSQWGFPAVTDLNFNPTTNVLTVSAGLTTAGAITANTGIFSGDVSANSFHGTGADYAEWFECDVDPDTIPTGNIIGLDYITGKVSNYVDNTDSYAIGVKSTNPVVVGGSPGPTKVRVALVGQVPVNSDQYESEYGDVYAIRGGNRTQKIGKMLYDGNVFLKVE